MQVGGAHVDLEDAEVDVVDAEALGDDARELVGADRAFGKIELEGEAPTGFKFEDLFRLTSPAVLIGLLIGGMMIYLFAALAIEAVGRAGGEVVEQVRKQFREHPGIMEGTEKPEYGRTVAIVTAAAQREMILPSLIPIIVPIIVGVITRRRARRTADRRDRRRALHGRLDHRRAAAPGTTRRS